MQVVYRNRYFDLFIAVSGNYISLLHAAFPFCVSYDFLFSIACSLSIAIQLYIYTASVLILQLIP